MVMPRETAWAVKVLGESRNRLVWIVDITRVRSICPFRDIHWQIVAFLPSLSAAEC